MGIRQKGATVLALLVLSAGVSGCKNQKPKATEPVPTPTAQAQLEKNPFIELLIEQMDAKDILRGQMAEKLDSYKPKVGETDYSGLAKTALLPFTDADALLADVSIVSIGLKKQADGSFLLAQDNTQATLVQTGQQMIYTAKVANASDPTAYTRQSATFAADGSQMDVQVYEKPAAQGEITLIKLQWIRQDSTSYMQYYYTTDSGDTYNVLRVLLTANSLEFALYEQVQSAPNLFELSTKDFFKTGYITKGSYAGNIATVYNENHTLTVGP